VVRIALRHHGKQMTLSSDAVFAGIPFEMNEHTEALAALKHLRELHFMNLPIEATDWARLESAITRLGASAEEPSSVSSTSTTAPQPHGAADRNLFEVEVRRHFDPARADELLLRDADGGYAQWGLMLAWEVWTSAWQKIHAPKEEHLTVASMALSRRIKASSILEAFRSCGRVGITLNQRLGSDDIAELLAHLVSEPVWYATHGLSDHPPADGLPVNVVGGSSSAAQAKYWADECGLRVVPLYARSST
jgi:hypothetical protein